MQTLILFDPTAPRASEAVPAVAQSALRGLAGATVGFIDNAKPNFNYLAEDLAVAEHAGAAARAVLELDPPSGAIPLLEVGPVRRQDVGVDVDGHRSITVLGS
jgi:hypothetical protein